MTVDPEWTGLWSESPTKQANAVANTMMRRELNAAFSIKMLKSAKIHQRFHKILYVWVYVSKENAEVFPGWLCKGQQVSRKAGKCHLLFFYNNNTYFGLGFCTSSRCSGMHNGSAGIKFDPGGWWGFSIQGHFKIDGLSHFFFVFFLLLGKV